MQHTLVHLVAAVVGSPIEYTNLWYHMFTPIHLAGSYIPGFNVSYTAQGHIKSPCINETRHGSLPLRWRCANLMRFITLQVALFSSNSILYRRAPVCIVFVYRYTSIIASFSHEVLANVEQRAHPV